MSKELVDLVQSLGPPRVLVVGDVMMDRYVWGDAERISQEAPVILLRADRREERLGGGSSVATMLRALGARSCWRAWWATITMAAAFARCSPTWASTTKLLLPTLAGRAPSRNATLAGPSIAIRSRSYGSITKTAAPSAMRSAARSWRPCRITWRKRTLCLSVTTTRACAPLAC